MEVEAGVWSSVFPSQPVEGRIVPLNPLNNTLAPLAAYSKKIIFFHHGPQGSDTMILRKSLAKVLDYFYPFAGRLSVRHGKQLQLHCNNKYGVSFLEATTAATIASLGNPVLPCDFIDKLCQVEDILPRPQYPWLEEYPLLSVQVTRFACGGMSLGLRYSHQICDAFTFWYFVNSWAEVARLGTPAVAPEIHYQIEESEVIPDLSTLNMVPVPVPIIVQMILHIANNVVELVTVSFSKQKLLSLKSQAPGCSSFNIACASVWSRIAKSWECVDTGNLEKSSLLFAVSCREKTSWLSSNYVGNALLTIAVTTTITQLQNDSLASIARLIHQTVAKFCTKQNIESQIRAVHAYDDQEMLLYPNVVSSPKFNVVVAGSPRLPIYDIDFGWGKVSGASVGTQNLRPNGVYLLPSAQDGGIDAVVGLKAVPMKRFMEQDSSI